MRTSRISQETTQIFDTLSSPTRIRRSTRQAAKTISAFAHDRQHATNIKGKTEKEDSSDDDDDDEHSSDDAVTQVHLSTSTDIEDVVTTSAPTCKRKRGTESPATITTAFASSSSSSSSSKPRPSPRKLSDASPILHSTTPKDDLPDTNAQNPSPKLKASPHRPAYKTVLLDGTTTTHPPSNWAPLYAHLKAYRSAHPTAPVDTMGCDRLFWPSSPPAEQRYHTLTALMLSSQTKDTVTAAAMQRLHTELIATSHPHSASSNSSPLRASQLTIPNILHTPAAHLDSLISKVGFHTTKTRHLQQTAQILSQPPYNGTTIPATLEGLLALPGVGPKMAYLTLSAAWGVDEGIGVDVHVHRITNMWGWHATKTPEQTRGWLQGWLPRDKWKEINHLIVGLGQTVCPAGPGTGRKRCGECGLGGTGLCRGEVRKGGKVIKRRRRRRRRSSSEGMEE